MKKISTLMALLCLTITYSAKSQICQTETFSAPTTTWTFSQGAHVGPYKSPLLGCDENRGIITPGVGGNNPCNIRTSEYISTGAASVRLTFEMIVLDANLKCNTWKDFDCETSVDVFYYVNDVKYTGVIDFALPPNGPNNSPTVNIIFQAGHNLPSGTPYSIEFCFKPKSGIGNCIQQNTKYVFDNFRRCETAQRIVTSERGIPQQPINITVVNMPAAETTMFPNPTNGSTKINIAGLTSTHKIQLFDNAGRMVKYLGTVINNNLDIKGIKTGTYMIRIIQQADGTVQTRKLIVN